MAVNDVTTGGQLGETHQLAPDPEEVDIPPSLDPLKDTTVNGPASSERATRTARDIRKQVSRIESFPVMAIFIIAYEWL